MMWDAEIRYGEGTEKDYFQFLTDMKELWNSLEATITEPQTKYGKPVTRIIDEYNWLEAHPLPKN
jgi:hypothetical protein